MVGFGWWHVFGLVLAARVAFGLMGRVEGWVIAWLRNRRIDAALRPLEAGWKRELNALPLRRRCPRYGCGYPYGYCYDCCSVDREA